MIPWHVIASEPCYETTFKSMIKRSWQNLTEAAQCCIRVHTSQEQSPPRECRLETLYSIIGSRDISWVSQIFRISLHKSWVIWYVNCPNGKWKLCSVNVYYNKGSHGRESLLNLKYVMRIPVVLSCIRQTANECLFQSNKKTNNRINYTNKRNSQPLAELIKSS